MQTPIVLLEIPLFNTAIGDSFNLQGDGERYGIMQKPSKEVTKLQSEVDASPRKAADQLASIVYDELRAMAQRLLNGERKSHTLQPTALVHEAFLRLADQSRVNWQGRTHFLAVGASIMRRVLIDYARTRGRNKRGGDFKRVVLEDTLIYEEPQGIDLGEVNEAIEELSRHDAEEARIVELRFFGGLSVEEVAHALGVSKRKVEGEWTHAKAWLRNRLKGTAA